MSNVDAIKIRMYNTGSVGDCLLLLFQKANKTSFSMLIDCGGFNTSTQAISACVSDIKETLDGVPIDLVVVTHEHLDHVSGFNQAKAVFDQIAFRQVWMAWTESDTDPLAKKLKKQLGKKLAALAVALQSKRTLLRHKMAAAPSGSSLKKKLKRYDNSWKQALDTIHFESGKGFSVATTLALRVSDAMTYVKGKSKSKAKTKMFRYPGEVIDDLQGAEGIKIHILGPPYDNDLSGIKNKTQEDEMYSFTRHLSFASRQAFLSAIDKDEVKSPSPFNKKYSMNPVQEKKFMTMYDEPARMRWRQIEEDWMEASGDIAAAVNSYTNNTSLAMAIEFAESGKVLLFPADAQSGNWISWHNTDVSHALVKNGGKKADELLENTVFYKVGHHGSHNGTASKSGLDKINGNQLVAMIPLILDKVPTQWGGAKNFPAKALYKQLIQKTNGAVIRTDEGLISDKRAKDLRAKNLSQAIQKKLGKVSDNPLYQEWKVEG